VRVAAAHELAHIRRRHVWKGLAWFALLSLPGLYVVALATRRRGGLAEPRAVPLAALVLLCLQLALLPLTNAISRRYEVEADWIALETTRDPAAARGLFEGFAATDLTDPRPPAWSYVLLDDHPTLLQRIALTRAWRARLDRDDHRVERELDVDVEVVR
jgi:STE24 endopeptidase